MSGRKRAAVAILVLLAAGGPCVTSAHAGPDEGLIRASSELDGALLVVGTDIKDGEKVDPARVVTVRVGEEVRKYRRLRVGDAVEEGQVLARLDDSLARVAVTVRAVALETAQAELRVAEATLAEATRRYESYLKAIRVDLNGEEISAARLTRDRFRAEQAVHAARVREAAAELSLARLVLARHEVRSPARGVVAALVRSRGEAVRKGGTVVIVRAGPAPRERVRVPALRAGALLVVGTEVRPGEVVPATKRVEVEVPVLAIEAEEGKRLAPDERVAVPGQTEPYRRYRNGDELVPGKLAVVREKKRFRKLEVGDKVTEGQVVGLVGFDLALANVEVRLARLDTAEQTRIAADKTKEEASRRVVAMEQARSRARGSVSDDDYYAAKLQLERYRSEAIAAAGRVREARAELSAALIRLRMHEVRSPETGRVSRLLRRRGEAVNELATVLEVEVDEGPAAKP